MNCADSKLSVQVPISRPILDSPCVSGYQTLCELSKTRIHQKYVVKVLSEGQIQLLKIGFSILFFLFFWLLLLCFHKDATRDDDNLKQTCHKMTIFSQIVIIAVKLYLPLCQHRQWTLWIQDNFLLHPAQLGSNYWSSVSTSFESFKILDSAAITITDTRAKNVTLDTVNLSAPDANVCSSIAQGNDDTDFPKRDQALDISSLSKISISNLYFYEYEIVAKAAFYLSVTKAIRYGEAVDATRTGRLNEVNSTVQVEANDFQPTVYRATGTTSSTEVHVPRHNLDVINSLSGPDTLSALAVSA